MPATTREVTRPQAEYDPRPVTFDTLGLEPSLIEGIRIRGFSTTTPIQSAVIPIVMSGDDIIGCADTGTGKTAAFLLPILNRMLRARALAPEERGYTRVLILAPTRELAVQIEDDVQGFIYHTDITSIAVYGGVDMGPQERALKSGVDIVVATPGRLMDHMRQQDGRLRQARHAGARRGGPDDGHGLLARRPPDRAGAAGFGRAANAALLGDDAGRGHEAGRRGRARREVRADWIGRRARQEHHAHDRERAGCPRRPSGSPSSCAGPTAPCWCSCGRRSGAERLARKLASFGLKAAALHADRTQAQRTQAVEGFRSGSYRVLVATDVAARGLDIDGITHVVNYEVPSSREMYVHRVGRTGRADATGTALTLVAPEELRALQALQRSFGLELQG